MGELSLHEHLSHTSRYGHFTKSALNIKTSFEVMKRQNDTILSNSNIFDGN